MLKIIHQVKKSRGAALVEYAVMLALILVVAVSALQKVGDTVNKQMLSINTSIGGSK